MITNEHTNYAFVELNRIIPPLVVSSSLSLIINPHNFKLEYRRFQYDTDKYFMHVSNVASEQILQQLATISKDYDPTQTLRLISAKIILGIQEMSELNSVEAANFLREDKSEWLKYLYHNQGALAERFK